ncbi:hypothetical protein [uncultured Bacteroides sp.]|uniref:hypothetical protein n=1 Tax=uncultured Bacteroides sp. TaxID=162156 RepID=UPI002610CF98|nr:hypothetical protein [uncultured Bacteroides sp.]
MSNLQMCENLGIEIKFEKMLIKWNKITFILFAIIEVIGIIATLVNSQEFGILFLPLIFVSVVSFLVIRVFAEISMSLKISNENKV